MTKVMNNNRRDFLKVSGMTAALVASQGSLFAKTNVMSVENGKENYPNTNYTESMYRNEFAFTYGKKEEHGFAYHCVNCQGNCAWEVWSHNGVVTRENQSSRYPIINAKIPDFNPRGCNKGVQHSQVMYQKDRILYPMKRVGERGAGKWIQNTIGIGDLIDGSRSFGTVSSTTSRMIRIAFKTFNLLGFLIYKRRQTTGTFAIEASSGHNLIGFFDFSRPCLRIVFSPIVPFIRCWKILIHIGNFLIRKLTHIGFGFLVFFLV